VTKRKKVTLISNVCIACVLVGLSIAIFTADLTSVFISVSAPVTSGKDGVSLMFVLEDDADQAEEIITYLQSQSMPATFFVGGNWTTKSTKVPTADGLVSRQNSNAIMRIAGDPNFELGNHAYTNRNLAGMKESDQFAEIRNCHTRIYTLTSSTKGSNIIGGNENDIIENPEPVSMNLFLPPNGSFNKRTLRSAEKLGYRTVMWSKDATKNGQELIYNPAQKIQGGDLILLRADTASYALLHLILNYCKTNNLGLEKVSKNIINIS